MIYWAPLLHFYQPPTQLYSVLRKVCDECYRPLLQVLGQYPHARATVNINGVLTELLGQHGFGDIIEGLRELAARGQIEFTGSAKYHAILPLLPNEEVRRQVRLNSIANRHYLGEVYQPRGFFPPELAYGPDLLGPVLDSHHAWVLVSGVACPTAWPINVVHEVQRGFDSLAVLFRDDVLSNRISFQQVDGRGFLEHLRSLAPANGDMYVVTAMDAETFGHHIQNWERLFLAEVYEALADPQGYGGVVEHHRDLYRLQEEEALPVRSVTISEIVDAFPRGAAVEPRPSSWSTTQEDLAAGVPYPLWQDRHNAIHRLQWEHVDICIQLVRKAQEVASNDTSQGFATIARSLLDPALHSCQFWWASQRAGWDINLVHRGLQEQEEVILNACKAIEVSGCAEAVRRECSYRAAAARDLRARIVDRLLRE